MGFFGDLVARLTGRKNNKGPALPAGWMDPDPRLAALRDQKRPEVEQAEREIAAFDERWAAQAEDRRELRATVERGREIGRAHLETPEAQRQKEIRELIEQGEASLRAAQQKREP